MFFLKRKTPVKMSNAPVPSSTKRLQLIKIVLTLLIAVFLSLIFIKFGKKGSLSSYSDNSWPDSKVPKEMQINYIPADFSIPINEEEALVILANPNRYRREFNQLVYDINTGLLDHVANRMGLDKGTREKIRVEYEKHHPYLRNLYFNDFADLQDTTSTLYKTWYNDVSTSAVGAIREVASKYTCFMVNLVFTTVLPTRDGALYVKGKAIETPCGIALTEGLQPMMHRMQERAAIEDFGRNRGLLQEKVERSMAELATFEIKDKKGLSKQMQTKMWGFSISSTNIEISAISILKIGFDLDQYFDISLNANRGLVTITLPPPKVVSHEVYPSVDMLDIGWLRELKEVDLNKSFNTLRAEFRREALESNRMEDAKTKAVEIMNTMFLPMVQSINKNYQLRVTFRDSGESQENIEVKDVELQQPVKD